ncbi:short chain dehydrogenase [compost metagenome]
MLAAAFGQWLRRQDARGSVVNILDQKLFNLNPDYFSYTLSKLALKESIRLQAMAAAPYLRVNGVAPGLTLLSGEQTADNFARAHRMTALGEGTRPQSVAEAVHFLAEAAQITGQVLTVDDGQHLLPLARDVMFAVEA